MRNKSIVSWWNIIESVHMNNVAAIGLWHKLRIKKLHINNMKKQLIKPSKAPKEQHPGSRAGLVSGKPLDLAVIKMLKEAKKKRGIRQRKKKLGMSSTNLNQMKIFFGFNFFTNCKLKTFLLINLNNFLLFKGISSLKRRDKLFWTKQKFYTIILKNSINHFEIFGFLMIWVKQTMYLYSLKWDFVSKNKDNKKQ